MATIGGYIHPAADFGNEAFNDFLWDVSTSAAYNHYMQANVFNPVGAFPVLAKDPFTALAYRSDASGTGWNSGSFFGSPGGVGWHMTINENLDVAGALRAGADPEPAGCADHCGDAVGRIPPRALRRKHRAAGPPGACT